MQPARLQRKGICHYPGTQLWKNVFICNINERSLSVDALIPTARVTLAIMGVVYQIGTWVGWYSALQSPFCCTKCSKPLVKGQRIFMLYIIRMAYVYKVIKQIFRPIGEMPTNEN